MYLEEQNSDLNDEINDLICLSNDLTSLEDRLAVKLKGWNLIPESKINFVALLIAIHHIKRGFVKYGVRESYESFFCTNLVCGWCHSFWL